MKERWGRDLWGDVTSPHTLVHMNRSGRCHTESGLFRNLLCELGRVILPIGLGSPDGKTWTWKNISKGPSRLKILGRRNRLGLNFSEQSPRV